MAIAWVLRDGGITTALIGASRPSQVEDCVGAVDEPRLHRRRARRDRPLRRRGEHQPLGPVVGNGDVSHGRGCGPARADDGRHAYAVRALSPETWPDFARLVEAHNGVWGGCWCLAFHAGDRQHRTFEGPARGQGGAGARGRTHAALVYAGSDCVGWAQFGSPDELPAIKNRKDYEAGLDRLPDWRITCLFVGKGHRKQGVAEAAVAGAVDEIARLGGGTVEGYPEESPAARSPARSSGTARSACSSGSASSRCGKIGKHKWVVRRTVAAEEA